MSALVRFSAALRVQDRVWRRDRDSRSRSRARLSDERNCVTASFSRGKLVRLAGLEPARVAPLPPQSSVSANSTIGALGAHNEPSSRAPRKGNLDSLTGVRAAGDEGGVATLEFLAVVGGQQAGF